jgi:hypothetical protein
MTAIAGEGSRLETNDADSLPAVSGRTAIQDWDSDGWVMALDLPLSICAKWRLLPLVPDTAANWQASDRIDVGGDSSSIGWKPGRQ